MFAGRNRGVLTSHGLSFLFAGSTDRSGSQPLRSTEEIHEAYRLKSKKHHPDLGGDEWAFRMVTRAYEVLKATATATSSKLDATEEARPDPYPAREKRRAWIWGAPSRRRRADLDSV